MENEELLTLVKRVKEGDEIAIESLYNDLHNFIRNIWNDNYSAFISFEDALNVSYLAVYNAAINFDPSKNVHFKTYASPYIKGEIIKEINLKRGIDLPEKIIRNAQKIYEIVQDYASEHEGSKPSDGELEEILCEKDIKLSHEEIEACRVYYQSINTYSLDSEDFYETSVVASSDEYLPQEIFDIVADAANLDNKEKHFLPYVGAYLNKEKTLKEIASQEHMSVDIARSIIESCVAKLKKKRKIIKKAYNGKPTEENKESSSENLNPFDYEYEFTDEDRKTIGKNIKALREANNCDNSVEFYEFLNRPQKLSAKTLGDIENGSYKQISKSKIIDVARLLGSSYDSLVFENLIDEYEKDFYAMDDDEHPLDYIEYADDPEMKGVISDLLQVLFPIITSKKAKESKCFCDAMDLWRGIIVDNRNFDEKTIDQIVFSLEKSFKYDNIPEACVNALSILGTYYLCALCPGDEKLIKMRNTEYDNHLDYTSKMARDKELIEVVLNQRKTFISKYEECLSKNTSRLMKNEKFSDFAMFFLAIRYAFAIMDNNKMKLSNLEMNVFGVSLLQNLRNLKNKYAIKYYKYLESD